MQITLTLDTTEPLSGRDTAVLTALLRENGAAPAPEAAPASEAAPAPEATEDEAPKPRRKRRTKAEMEAARKAEAEAADEAADDANDDANDADDAEPKKASDEPTLDDAIAAATALVASGKAAKVKEALNEVGAEKVSGLKGSKQIAAFLSELEG